MDQPPDRPAEPSGPRPARQVAVRAAARSDWWWLTKQGLSPSMVGVQYHWVETPLQLVIAPARGSGLRSGPRAIIEVDGARAGYIGRNPLSGNLEYFVLPWARGGVGSQAIEAFLRHHRTSDRDRLFFVSHHNERSLNALTRALARLGWVEGEQYSRVDGRHGWRVTIHQNGA